MTNMRYPIITDALAPESDHDGVSLTAVNQVFRTLIDEAPWVDYQISDFLPLQLEAFNERLRQRRGQIAALGQRATQLGIDKAESLEDVAALVFSSATYKSYPDSFIAKGQWPQLLRWLDTLSTHRLTEVDVADSVDLDDFLNRIRAAGHRVLNSSGTSGKPSLFPESRLDDDRVGEIVARLHGWMIDLDPDNEKRILFYTGNGGGNMGGRPVLESLEHAYTRPGSRYNLFEESMRTAEVGRVAKLNKALADGTATPGEITELRREQARADERTREALERFADLLIEHADEPFVMCPHVWRIHQVMEVIKKRGKTVTFHPDSRIWIAGGIKNNQLPDDYLDQLREFFDIPIRSVYGQSEFKATCIECRHGRNHVPPQIILLLLDPSGSEVMNLDTTSGTVEGLFAGFDISVDGRWGGLATNDWLTVNYDPCPCGLRAPAVTSVSRVDALKKNDDKVNCGGRIEMYVRGA